MKKTTIRINVNGQIRAPEIRVLGPEGENWGIMKTEEALSKANSLGFDLIEISPDAVPPVAKIADYGKFQYEQNKKAKLTKAKIHKVETKSAQIKIGTGEHDLNLKAQQISKWLKEGHRVKLDLFLKGRSKYMELSFLQERLDRVLHFLTEEYKITDGPQKSPKGLTIVLEKK